MLLFFCDFAAAQGRAQESEIAVKKSIVKPAKEAPTKIRSDIIDIKRKSQVVNFVGNVVIEKEDSSLLSQKMTILYNDKKDKKNKKVTEPEEDESQASEQSSIKKIYTDEKVKIFSEDFVATGDSGYYDPKADVFILEKNVMVNNGVSIAKGDKFIHHISTKKSNFVGQKEDKTTGEDKRVVVILGDDAKDLKKPKEKK